METLVWRYRVRKDARYIREENDHFSDLDLWIDAAEKIDLVLIT